jgi:Flp pilus assembly pilin Flp
MLRIMDESRAAAGTFLRNDSGQDLVEYALIIALIVIVAMATLSVLGRKASNTLSNAANSLK